MHNHLLFALACVAGCGGSGDMSPPDLATSDLTIAPDLTILYPAPHSPMPQAQSAGGPVMKAPKLLAISFMGDPLQQSIDDFTAKTAASAYWAGTTAEYGVGPATALMPFHATDAPTPKITDGAIRTWLSVQIKMTPNFPQPDANTLYTIFYPNTVTITSGSGTSCKEFQGYHDAYMIGNQPVIYAVVARCPPPVQSVTVLDNLTATASHEFVEAATDPLPSLNPAWINIDDDHVAFAFLAGPELGDLCAAYPDSFYRPSDLPYLVQRTWSNASAAAGHDPCQPDGTKPYFNAAPLLKDAIMVTPSGVGVIETKGVHIPVGQSATVELDLYSDAPTGGPWTLSVFDVGAAFMGQPTELDFSFDQTTGENGDKLMLTITALQASHSPTGASLFWLESDLQPAATDGGAAQPQSTVWLGVVGN